MGILMFGAGIADVTSIPVEEIYVEESCLKILAHLFLVDKGRCLRLHGFLKVP
jgi:hypothetical protein